MLTSTRDRVVVLITAHKPTPTSLEEISLKQCSRILGRHPIRLLVPQGLDTSAYRTLIPSATVEYIDPIWQSTYHMFLAMKVSPILYQMYSNFEYILFYEPDAFVFRDDLLRWCEQGYDYIGAPWFEGRSRPISNRIIGVGNGGFSLRKVSTHLELSLKYERRRALKGDSLSKAVERLRFLWQSFGFYERFRSLPRVRYEAPLAFPEDFFWTTYVAAEQDGYRVAPAAQAMRFSFEVNPRHLYELTEGVLPFGCHAWPKYDREFWNPHIENCGFKLIRPDD